MEPNATIALAVIATRLIAATESPIVEKEESAIRLETIAVGAGIGQVFFCRECRRRSLLQLALRGARRDARLCRLARSPSS